ncbi:MAG TPA: chromate transporter [Stellaceae bacterium]|nr:chromate transporter [Stellaceae bacterium]
MPLPALFAAFLRLGLMSFGGGTDGWVYRDIVERRHWLDERAFATGVALSRVMPGSGGVNLTVHVGRLLRGGAGAVVAALGLISGPLVVVIVLAVLYARIAGNPAVHAVLAGAAAAAVGLNLATGLKLAGYGDRSIGPLAVTLATVLAVGVLHWPMVPVIIGLAPVSIGLAFRQAKRQGGGDV